MRANATHPYRKLAYRGAEAVANRPHETTDRSEEPIG